MQQADQFKFFLTEEAEPDENGFTGMSKLIINLQIFIEKFSNKSFTKAYFDSMRDSHQSNNIMDNIFDSSKVSNDLNLSLNKISVPIIETKYNFTLDNVSKLDEYGAVKMNTFKEWARLSLLEHDSQKLYKEKNMIKMESAIKQLKIQTKKNSDFTTAAKMGKTEAHSKESMKAMKYILQKNVMKLIEIKEAANNVTELDPPELKTERISTKQFLPLSVLKPNTHNQLTNNDACRKEIQIMTEILQNKTIIKDEKHFEKMYNDIKATL